MRSRLLLLLVFPLMLPLGASATYRSDGALLSRSEEGATETFSYDEEGRLVEVKETGRDGLVSLTWYTYSLQSGALVMVQQASTQIFYDPAGDSFALSDGSSYESYEKLGDSYYLRSSVVGQEVQRNESSVTVDAEGHLVHSRLENGMEVIATYDENGNMIVETVKDGDTINRKTERSYDKAGLLESESVTYDDGREERRSYQGGILYSQLDLKDGVPQKATVFLPARVETVYDDGKPYAEIRYDADGSSVKEVAYL